MTAIFNVPSPETIPSVTKVIHIAVITLFELDLELITVNELRHIRLHYCFMPLECPRTGTFLPSFKVRV